MLLSANIFQPLIDVFQSVIEFFHNNMGISWGWSIVLLTVCVRLILVPLTVKQFASMRALQQHQPELKAIQQKYKDDKQRQQQEMMAFYKENNVNPFASCLPMVLQLPVFISLFYMLRKNLRTDICPTVQKTFQDKYASSHHVTLAVAKAQTTACSTYGAVKGSGFLFIHDITNTATGLTLVALLVLYVGTQLASTMLMAQPTMDPTQRRMMMIMPLFFVLFVIRFPAGLIVYWITTNAWTMAQQWVLRQRIGPPPAAVTVGALGDDSGGNGSSGGGIGSLVGRLRSRESARAGESVGSATRSKPGAKSSAASGAAPRAPAVPPRPPRKKKKRSGRRR